MPATATLSEYKGKPIVTFSSPERTPFPFGFGPNKAQILLDFINTHGAPEFVKQLEKVASKDE